MVKGSFKLIITCNVISFTSDYRAIFFLIPKLGSCQTKKSLNIYSAIAEYLRKHSWLTMINDYTTNLVLYPNAVTLPALPHALIDTSGMTETGDYIKLHKNIRRKYQGHQRSL